MAQTQKKKQPEWLKILQRVVCRNGTVEVTSAKSIAEYDQANAWRLRVLEVHEGKSFVVERPWVDGGPVVLHPNHPVIVLVAEGNNRWSFVTTMIEQTHHELNEKNKLTAWRLDWPSRVSSAQRRDFFRVYTGGTPLAKVEVRQLVDLESTIEFEHYQISGIADNTNQPTRLPPEPQLGEEVFYGIMLDISGGGLRLALPHEVQPMLEENATFWLKLQLPPLENPLYLVARPAHWQVISEEIINVGMAFHYDHNPAYKRFVTDSLCRANAHLQRMMLQRRK